MAEAWLFFPAVWWGVYTHIHILFLFLLTLDQSTEYYHALNPSLVFATTQPSNQANRPTDRPIDHWHSLCVCTTMWDTLQNTRMMYFNIHNCIYHDYDKSLLGLWMVLNVLFNVKWWLCTQFPVVCEKGSYGSIMYFDSVSHFSPPA